MRSAKKGTLFSIIYIDYITTLCGKCALEVYALHVYTIFVCVRNTDYVLNQQSAQELKHSPLSLSLYDKGKEKEVEEIFTLPS